MKRVGPYSRKILAGLAILLLPLAGLAQYEGLEAFIDAEARTKNLPLVSIVLVDDAGIAWSYGVGTDTAHTGISADANTTYRIGSVSKLFTDIVVMQMVEKGLLDLDEPVTTYLPDFRPDNDFGAPVTLRSLTSHSSGLVREPPVGNYFDDAAPTLAETVLSLNHTALVYAPGSKVQYSNAGIAVVGRVVEKVAGKPFAEVLKENALHPVGMTRSAFEPEEDVVALLPAAWMWNYQGDRTVAPTFELGMAPAGSMYSSMNDLALFMVALIRKGQGLNGRILAEETLDEMWTPQSTIRSGRGRSFGIGFNLGTFGDELSVSHGGAIYGFATQLKVLPGSKAGVAIATNLDMANGAIDRIADLALATLLAARNDQPPPAYAVSTAIPADDAKTLVGVYRNGEQSIRVTRRFGDLYVERVNGLSLRLRNAGGDTVIDDVMLYSDDVGFGDGDVTVFGTTYAKVADVKPAPVKADWAELIGEYGFDYNTLYINEDFGQLQALIEWGTEYPLVDLGNGRFRFPPYGLYPNETLEFERDGNGHIVDASLNGIRFPSRPFEGTEGGVFQMPPEVPVSDLEKIALAASPPEEKGDFRDADLVDITDYSDRIKLDIRYASDRNFLGVPVYSTARAFMQRPAAEALARISNKLAEKGYGLLVHDAYRPWYVTKIFWDATPEEGKIFVADPSEGSRHNRGCAIDLTLYDLESGEPIEMVGLYDEMSERSYPHYPGGTSLQRWHRELLREAMESEGFTVYEYEWWHFDFDGWDHYRIGTDTFEQLDAAARH